MVDYTIYVQRIYIYTSSRNGVRIQVTFINLHKKIHHLFSWRNLCETSFRDSAVDSRRFV